MASYLEDYGAAEQEHSKRSKLIQRAIVITLVLLLVASVVYGVFKNYPEERQAKQFIALLQRQDFAAAYRLWGCSPEHPCRDYSFARFTDDWGGKSDRGDFTKARIAASESCGSGVLLQLSPPNGEPASLWVERGTRVLSFSPWPQCPGRHLHVGAFLRRLFHQT